MISISAEFRVLEIKKKTVYIIRLQFLAGV